MNGENTNPFDYQVKIQIQKIKDDSEKLKANIQSLTNAIEENEKKIKALSGYLSIINPSTLSIESHHEKPQITIKRSNSTIGDMIEKILVQLSRPAHYTEIMDLIESQEKITIGGKNPKGTMTAHLSNDSRFIKTTQRGFWELKKENCSEQHATQSIDDRYETHQEVEDETHEIIEGIDDI